RPGRLTRTAVLAATGVIAASLAACTSTRDATPDSSSRPAPSTSSTSAGAQPRAPQVAVAALRPGERWIDLAMPGGSYRPQAEAGGTDDYRCILLDPKITSAAFL